MSRLVLSILACVLSGVLLDAQTGALNGEWRSYGGDTGHTRYAPLDQINAANFSKLTVAWRFKTDHLGPRPEFMFESTPVMANGVLYSTAGSRRAVVTALSSTRRPGSPACGSLAPAASTTGPGGISIGSTSRSTTRC